MDISNIDPHRLPHGYTQVWIPTRPSLVISKGNTQPLGNCYRRYGFTIVSRFRLSAAQLEGLFKLGFLAGGQSFKVESQHDGKEEPGIIDEVPCRVVNTRGEAVDVPAYNQYGKGELLGTQKYEYYVYNTWTYCDSGD